MVDMFLGDRGVAKEEVYADNSLRQRDDRVLYTL